MAKQPEHGGLPPDRSEPDPKVARLDTHGREGPPPTAPLAGEGPVPRLLHQNARSPGGGLKRFKIRALIHPAPWRYILAHNEEEARTHYLQSTGLDRQLAIQKADALRSAGGDPNRAALVDEPRLTVTVLID